MGVQCLPRSRCGAAAPPTGLPLAHLECAEWEPATTSPGDSRAWADRGQGERFGTHLRTSKNFVGRIFGCPGVVLMVAKLAIGHSCSRSREILFTSIEYTKLRGHAAGTSDL